MKTSSNSFLDLSYNALLEKFTQLQILEKQRKRSSGSEWSITESQKRINLSRNRYSDIVPYDKSRVKLINSENNYINASYILLPNDKKYIASQVYFFKMYKNRSYIENILGAIKIYSTAFLEHGLG